MENSNHETMDFFLEMVDFITSLENDNRPIPDFMWAWRHSIVKRIEASTKSRGAGAKTIEGHCIVSGCKNKRDQGRFVNDLCAPCYEYLRDGKIGHTTSFLGELEECRAFVLELSGVISENGSLIRDVKRDE